MATTTGHDAGIVIAAEPSIDDSAGVSAVALSVSPEASGQPDVTEIGCRGGGVTAAIAPFESSVVPVGGQFPQCGDVESGAVVGVALPVECEVHAFVAAEDSLVT